MTKEVFEKVFADTAEESGVAELARKNQFAENLEAMMCELRDKLNSIPSEQPSEELNKEIDRFIADKVGKTITVGQVAHYFVKWQKEQLMKNCLYDTEVMLRTKQNNTEYLTLANDKLPHVPVSCGLNVGDKVKILIIKEEEQCSTE